MRLNTVNVTNVDNSKRMNLNSTPGQKFRSIRESLYLTLRDVEAATYKIAAEYGRQEFLIPHSRLFEIESRGAIPTIFRLYSLSVIYRNDYSDLLRLFGVELDNVAAQLKYASVPVTHRIENKLALPMTYSPDRLESSSETTIVRPETPLEEFSAVPVGISNSRCRDSLIYAYVGTEDPTMYPLILPGSVVQVDQSLCKIRNNGWRSEYERPIYLIETRNDGYRIGWCSVSGRDLTVHPHPLSSAQVKQYRVQDADVIGQVVAISTRLLSYQM
jgi:hypothetical protein